MDASKKDDKRLCRKDKRRDSTVPGMFASMVPFECLMFLCPKAITWRPGASETSAWKVIFLDASRVHWQADATKEHDSRVTARGASDIVLPKDIAQLGEESVERDPNEAAERARNRFWRRLHLRENHNKKKAVRDPGDDDDDKTVAIPSHQDGEIEIHSEFCRQIKIETD